MCQPWFEFLSKNFAALGEKSGLMVSGCAQKSSYLVPMALTSGILTSCALMPMALLGHACVPAGHMANMGSFCVPTSKAKIVVKGVRSSFGLNSKVWTCLFRKRPVSTYCTWQPNWLRNNGNRKNHFSLMVMPDSWNRKSCSMANFW